MLETDKCSETTSFWRIGLPYRQGSDLEGRRFLVVFRVFLDDVLCLIQKIIIELAGYPDFVGVYLELPQLIQQVLEAGHDFLSPFFVSLRLNHT